MPKDHSAHVGAIRLQIANASLQISTLADNLRVPQRDAGEGPVRHELKRARKAIYKAERLLSAACSYLDSAAP